jgi:hypothetical protein
VVAVRVDPARQRDGFADLGFAKNTAGMRALEGHDWHLFVEETQYKNENATAGRNRTKQNLQVLRQRASSCGDCPSFGNLWTY